MANEDTCTEGENEAPYADRWLRVPDMLAITGWKSRSTLMRRVRAGWLPEPFYPFGERGGACWWESEVLEAMRRLDDREHPEPQEPQEETP